MWKVLLSIIAENIRSWQISIGTGCYFSSLALFNRGKLFNLPSFSDHKQYCKIVKGSLMVADGSLQTPESKVTVNNTKVVTHTEEVAKKIIQSRSNNLMTALSIQCETQQCPLIRAEKMSHCWTVLCCLPVYRTGSLCVSSKVWNMLQKNFHILMTLKNNDSKKMSLFLVKEKI